MQGCQPRLPLAGKSGYRGRVDGKVADHARKVHKVQTLTDTLVNFMKTAIRR